MSMRLFKKTAALGILISILAGFSGCWDSKEIDTIQIVTGVGLDKAENDEYVDISIQIAKTSPSAPGTKDSNGNGDSKIILESSKQTILEGVAELNLNNSRSPIFHHNQVLLISADLAKEGITEYLDAFMRDREARLEVLVVIVDGEAKEMLQADFEQEKVSGIFLRRTIRLLSNVTPEYSVRMIDLASRLRDESISPVATLVRLEDNDDKKNLLVEGMAVFDSEGKMIGNIDADEMRGYVWAMGKVEQGRVAVECEYGRAAFQIISMDCKRNVKLNEKGQVNVSFDVDATLNIGELRGFENLTPSELISHLIEETEGEIEDTIKGTFQSMQDLGADIYGVGLDLKRHHPKQWDKLKDRWEDYFSEAELELDVNVRIPGTGQIKKSLEMEDGENES
ncbi:MAG: Ger(x)C family spore germination protein [Clostridiales bacterium]|nr:Ger(x)C family spore germination protein [Clostridiales bacterium]